MSSAAVAKSISADNMSQDTLEGVSSASYPETGSTRPGMPSENSQAQLPFDNSISDAKSSAEDTEEEHGQYQNRGNSRDGGRVVSWQSSAEPDEVLVISRPVEHVSSNETASNEIVSNSSSDEVQTHGAQIVVVADDESQREDAIAAGAESTTSSLYAASASLVGGMAGTSINGNMSIMGMGGSGGGGAPSGTLSPQYTLVNSDGASMRVHTGSIRERNLNRRISAIHEDDSDAYSESRRSDSLIFVHNPSPSSSVLQRRRYRLYNHNQPGTPYDGMQRCRLSEDDGGTQASMAGIADASSTGGMARALGESDCFSMVSGISEGGASTTRVRMATDRAYDALRIGPSNSTAFGYNNGQYYPNRPMSFATSSDPGLPSAGSYYDYYLGPDDYVPPSSAFPDDSDFDGGSGANDDQSGEIISLIRSDVAVYSGAGDDVKFPFLPDNFSELGASIVYSPGGALSVDLDRLSRDQSDFSYVTPATASNYYPYQTPEPSVAQQALDTHQSHHYRGLRPQMKLRKKGKSVKAPSVVNVSSIVVDAAAAAADRGFEGTSDGNVTGEIDHSLSTAAAAASNGVSWSKRPGGGNNSSPVSPLPASNELHRRYTRRYRNQSINEAYHHHHHHHHQHQHQHHQAATQAAAQAVAEAVAANGSSSNSPGIRTDTGTIRPNALMRFIKRITPKT